MRILSVCIILTSILIISCSTSQELTYRPVDSKELWNIRIEKGSVSGQFEVYIDDEIIFEETPDIFNDRIDEKIDYKGYPVRLLVSKYNYNSNNFKNFDYMLIRTCHFDDRENNSNPKIKL